MKCPYCNHPEDKVVDSRTLRDGELTRRRRECLSCSRRYTTYERIEEVLPMVVKKDGRREPFDRTKIMAGILKACEKRPVPMETIENLVNEAERAVGETQEKEVSSTVIGETVIKGLRDLDDVAYVRFASVYRSFKDINDFMDELRTILSQQK